MNVTLNEDNKKYLRSLAHERKPIIWIGQKGLTDNLLEEINIALEHHELIKIKLRLSEHEERDAGIEKICEETNADLIQRVGNIVTLYKRNQDKPVIKLP